MALSRQRRVGEGHALTIASSRSSIGSASRVQSKCPSLQPAEARSANESSTSRPGDTPSGHRAFYKLDAGHGRVPVLAEQEMYFRDLLEAIDHPVGISIHAAVGYLAPCALVTKLCLDYPHIKLVNIPFGPTMNYLVQLKDTIPDTIKIYVGMHNVLSGLAMGAWGAQVTETNQIPNLCQAVIDEFVAGDVVRAAAT